MSRHRSAAVAVPRAAVAVLLALACASGQDFTARFFVQLEPGRHSSFAVTVREKKEPLAAARFRQMVNSGFFDGCSFFRVVPGFIVQFGLSGNVTVQREWDARGLLRDEVNVKEPDWNMRGTIAFATTGSNTRGTQLFVNYDDNHALDTKNIAVFGRVVDGMSTLSAVYSGYRERPKQTLIRARGDAYLRSEFPRLSYVTRVQQVAFIEEPYALSKNATGMMLTLGMVGCALMCCAGARLLMKRMKRGYKKATTADADDFRPRDDEEGDDDDDDDNDAGSRPR